MYRRTSATPMRGHPSLYIHCLSFVATRHYASVVIAQHNNGFVLQVGSKHPLARHVAIIAVNDAVHKIRFRGFQKFLSGGSPCRHHIFLPSYITNSMIALISLPTDSDTVKVPSAWYIVGTSISPNFAAMRYSTLRPLTSISLGNSSIAIRT